VLILAILAAAWVSESVAQAQDPAVAEAAAYKHKKHGKHDKYDKEPKHDKYYEKHDGHEYNAERPYHGEEYYSGDKPSYSGEYSTGEGYYSGEGYSDPETPTPTTLPRHMDFTLQLAPQLDYIDPLFANRMARRTHRTTSAGRNGVLSAALSRKLAPASQPASMATFVSDSRLQPGFWYRRPAFCHAEETYGYKHEDDGVQVPVAEYESTVELATEQTYTECYGQKSYVWGNVTGYLFDISANAGKTCDPDLKADYVEETFGKLAVTPAMMQLPDSYMEPTVALATYGEYYDERSHAVCGLAWIFNGTGTYGTYPYSEGSGPEVMRNATANNSTFWEWIADQEPSSVTDQYAYFGSVSYVSVFLGATSAGKPVFVPTLPSNKTTIVNETFTTFRSTTEEGGSMGLLTHQCKHHRHTLPLLKYGIIESDLRRYTWDKVRTLRTASGVQDSFIYAK